MVLALHPTSSAYGTPETQGRIYWYDSTPSYPTCYFDGGDSYTGGSVFTYSQYWNRIMNHLNNPSPITIDLTGSMDENSGTVEAHIEVLDGLDDPNLKVEFMVFEDHLWYSGRQYRFVVRDILPNQTLGISEPGEAADFYSDFTISGDWDETEIGVVVFVQSLTTKEVLQAAQLSKIITNWTPESPTVQRGTDLVMDALVENITPWAQNGDFWLDVDLPNGEPYGGNPVMGPFNFTLPGNFSNTFNPSLFIPEFAPPATYTFHGRVGQHPWDIWQTSSFEVTVTP
ncbi:MAG: Omp28-related outer membrane protein [Candidatus Glassbacteria bacterium]